jgi:hypothetical protein
LVIYCHGLCNQRLQIIQQRVLTNANLLRLQKYSLYPQNDKSEAPTAVIARCVTDWLVKQPVPTSPIRAADVLSGDDLIQLSYDATARGCPTGC